MGSSRVIATTTTGVPIRDDESAFQTTDMTENIYYQRYENNDSHSIYIRKFDQTDGGLTIYYAYGIWANRASLTYTAFKA